MALLQFARHNPVVGTARDPDAQARAALLHGVSREGMPRTLAQIEVLSALLPAGNRVCVAHIDGPPIDDMAAAAARLARAGCSVMPHLPARPSAGPAKLHRLVRFAIACGVGPSLQVMLRCARHVTRLLTPFTPGSILSGLARHKGAPPDSLIAGIHLFPSGGIAAATDWTRAQTEGATT